MNDSGRQQGRRVVTADYAWYVLQSFIINNKRKTKHLPALPLLYLSLSLLLSYSLSYTRYFMQIEGINAQIMHSIYALIYMTM